MSRYRTSISAALLLLLAVQAVLLLSCGAEGPSGEEAPVSAKSGSLRVGVEPSLLPVLSATAPVFSEHYPEARITLSPGSFGELFNRFVRGELPALLVGAEPGEAERSALEQAGIDYRLEPVARTALLCISSSERPASLTIGELRDICTGRAGGGIVAGINGNDVMAQKRLMELVAPGGEALSARFAESDSALVKMVEADPGLIGILPLESKGTLMFSSTDSPSLRVVPVAESDSTEAISPSQYDVYRGRYPLAYVLYYMYRKQEPLATGFGAWLAREGQKGFARSVIAPYRRPVRVINLKPNP